MTRKETVASLRKEVRRLIKKNSIVVSREKFITSVGRAWVNERNNHTIKIPPLTTIDYLYVALHEIAHVILGHNEDDCKKKLYVQEYEAEKWALKKLKEFDVHKNFYKDYLLQEQRAKLYVFSYMLKEKGIIQDRIKNWILRF